MYIGPVYDEMIDIHYAQKNLKIDTDLTAAKLHEKTWRNKNKNNRNF